MKLLIKLGGALLEPSDRLNLLAAGLADLSVHHQLVVVHGGGRQLSRHLTEHGVESRFVQGLRVTTPEVLDAVVKVLAGEVNTQLVAALQCAGARAVGLTGADAGLAQAVPLSPELGAVGRVHQVRAALLDLLTSQGYLPVVACLAADTHGSLYNVNADQMAVAVAAGFQADRLLFLTDVEGVLDSEKRLIRELTAAQAADLVEQRVATGGMEAKLRACCDALGRGVPQVQIAAGSRPGVLDDLLAGLPIGTTIAAAAPAPMP